jgi:5-(carboxyamino)imidazole ribonucleotide synthase
MSTPIDRTDPLPARPPVVGMIGAGQLARMSHQAAIALDLPLRILAATPGDSAAQVSPTVEIGGPLDAHDLRRFAATCDVLTVDHEVVDLETVRSLADAGTVAARPSAAALAHATDKAHQRRRFADAGLPLPRHRIVDDRVAALEALDVLGWPGVIKTARGGYDGRGVWIVDDAAAAADVLDAIGPGTDSFPVLVIEEAVSIAGALAVVVVRGRGDDATWFAVTETGQVEGICSVSITPASVDAGVSADATRIALAAAEVVDAVGLCAVELFVDADGTVTINEVATRPHNSAHWSIEGAVCSQFENHLRAVAGLPLGRTDLTARAVVSVNVLGHADGRDPRDHLAAALSVPGAHVHLYGKGPRPGRKLGHVTVCADSVDDARSRARAAVAHLGDPVPEVTR